MKLNKVGKTHILMFLIAVIPAIVGTWLGWNIQGL